MDLKPLCIGCALVACALAQDRTIALMGTPTSAGVGATIYDSSFTGRYAHYLQGRNPAFNSGDGIHTNNHGHKLLYERVVAADLIGSAATSAREKRGTVPAASRLGDGPFPERVRKGQGQMLLFGPGVGLPRDVRGRSADLIFR